MAKKQYGEMIKAPTYAQALEAQKKAKKQYGEMIKQPSYEETVEKAKRIGYCPQDTDAHGRTEAQRQSDLRTAATQYQQRVAAAMQQARQKPSYWQNIGRYLTTNQPFLQSRTNTVVNAEQQQKATGKGDNIRDKRSNRRYHFHCSFLRSVVIFGTELYSLYVLHIADKIRKRLLCASVIVERLAAFRFYQMVIRVVFQIVFA